MCIGDYVEQAGEGGAWGDSDGRGSKEETTDSESRMARLVRTIEGEIVPRLVLSRRVTTVPRSVSAREQKFPTVLDIKELVRLLLAHDAPVASAYVEAVRQGGISLENICLQLLAPAARELGLLWEEDECDFMQVTVGLCRLHQVLRVLSTEFRVDECESSPGRRILLAPIPGDQHTFGITLVAQFLRRAGWEVWHEFPSRATDIVDVLRQNWFTVVGLSVATETRLDDVAALINIIRQFSRNRGIGVLVGGPLLVDKPEIAGLLGADATAADGNEAVLKAQQMCERRASRAASN
jgi:MerR family transcriptional regulator, light-induced transcriptional regulator